MYVVCRKLYRGGVSTKKLGYRDSDRVTGELATYWLTPPGKMPAMIVSIRLGNGRPGAPLAQLFRAELTGLGDNRIALRGLEKVKTDSGVAWLHQAWVCELMHGADTRLR